MKIKQVIAESFAYDFAEPYEIYDADDFIAKIKEWAATDFDDALMLATSGLEYEYPELHDQVCAIMKPYALKYVLEIAKNQHIPRDWELDDYFHHYVDRILKELQPDWPELDHIIAVADKAFQHAKKNESLAEGTEESDELVAEFLGYLDQKNYWEAFNNLITAYDTDRDCLQSWWASFNELKPEIMKGLLYVIKNESDIPVESIIDDMYADLQWPELVTVKKAMTYNKQQKAVGEAYDPDSDPVIGYVQNMYKDLADGATDLTVLNLRDYIYDTGSPENLARSILEIEPRLPALIQQHRHGIIKSMLEMVKKDYEYAGKALFPVFEVLQHLGIRWPECDRIRAALSQGAKQESVTENAKQFPAAEILKYVKHIHPEGEFNIDHVITDHPFWTEADVPVSSLHIFDPEQDDIYDPYNRVQDTDLYHVDKLIPNIAAILQNKPLVIDDAGYILDGNHRALAAQKAGLKMVPVWQPVKGQQGMAESNVFTNARMNAIKAGKDTFVVRGKTYKVTGDTTDELEAVVTESWSKKYKRSINCSHPKGFSQKAHCAGKKKHNESTEMEMVCEDCGMCQTHGDHSRNTLDEACWKGYHKEGNKKMFGKTYPNCVKNESDEGVAEGSENNGISFKVQKGKNKFATTLSVGVNPVGVYQYDADTGRSVAEVYPEFKGKGFGKLLVLHAIYTAAKLGLNFQEDESRTSEYDNVLDSLSSNGYIVDDDGYWYVTGEGEQYLQHSLKQGVAEEKCPSCGGPMFSEMIMNEKKDACYYKVKSRYKVWPSAYASGALVKCRKKGASHWGNKSESAELPDNEYMSEDLRKWFKEKWVRFGPDGKIRGDCARGSDKEGKPKCLPQSKAHSLGKKGRASAASRKRRQDPNAERSGKAINVNTKKESVAEDLGVSNAPRVPAFVQHMDKKLSDNLRSVFSFVIELNSEPRMTDPDFRRQVLAVFDKHKPEILRYMLHYIKHSDSDNVKWLTPGMIKIGIYWPELQTINQALNAKRPDRQVSENNYRYSEVHKQQAESDARVISSFLEKIRKQIEADPNLSANDISRFWDVIHSIKLFSRYRLDILQPVLEHHKKTIVYVILYLIKHNEIYDTIDDIIDNLKYARINWPELKTLQQALAQGSKTESVPDNFTESEQTPLDSLFYNAGRLLDKNISYVGNVIIALRNDDRINEPEFLPKTVELFGKYKPQIMKYILNDIAKDDNNSYSNVQWLIPRMKKLGIKWPEFKIIQKGITYGLKKPVSEADDQGKFKILSDMIARDFAEHPVRGFYMMLYHLNELELSVADMPEIKPQIDQAKPLVIRALLQSVKADNDGMNISNALQILDRMQKCGVNWPEIDKIRQGLQHNRQQTSESIMEDDDFDTLEMVKQKLASVGRKFNRFDENLEVWISNGFPQIRAFTFPTKERIYQITFVYNLKSTENYTVPTGFTPKSLKRMSKKVLESLVNPHSVIENLLMVLKEHSTDPSCLKQMQKDVSKLKTKFDWPELDTILKALNYLLEQNKTKMSEGIDEIESDRLKSFVKQIQQPLASKTGWLAAVTLEDLASVAISKSYSDNHFTNSDYAEAAAVLNLNNHKDVLIKGILENIKQNIANGNSTTWLADNLAMQKHILNKLGCNWPEMDRIASAVAHNAN